MRKEQESLQINHQEQLLKDRESFKKDLFILTEQVKELQQERQSQRREIAALSEQVKELNRERESNRKDLATLRELPKNCRWREGELQEPTCCSDGGAQPHPLSLNHWGLTTAVSPSENPQQDDPVSPAAKPHTQMVPLDQKTTQQQTLCY